MKLQHLAVLFVIIILPISILLSAYTSNQIDAINMQTAYDSNLVNATYDAVKAFQLNTTNNKYSSISDSKIRDIEASINTFYNSLNTSMSGYSLAAQDLEAYIPAILFTLYDGYYIYTSYDNVYGTTGEGEDEKVQISLGGKNYQNGLKPYVYYSAKYKLSNGNIIVVNYTLDNEITVYGDFGDGYVTRSGYLINPDYVTNVNTTAKTLSYGEPGNQVEIRPERLEEHLTTIEERDNGGRGTDSGDYVYVFYQNDKIYQDTDGSYFWYNDSMKTPVNDPNIIADLDYNKEHYGNNETIMSTSAFEYYYRAWDFSRWVEENLGKITQANTVNDNSNDNSTIGQNNVDYIDSETGEVVNYLSEDTGNTKIFNFDSENDPLLSSSAFNNHRLAIIRKTIEKSLNTVISNYHTTTLYDYAMPVISDDDWYRITNNVSMVTFMQGMSIGYRYYNNYAIITNNINKEVIKPENIYIVTEETSGNSRNREYHQPGCRELLQGIEDGTLRIVGTYPTASFQRQTVKVTENTEDDVHFYYQSRGTSVGGATMLDLITITGCYNCIVSATSNYDTNDIIAGNSLIDFPNRVENGGNGTISFTNDSEGYKAVRQAYLTALARERYDLYKSNFDLDL